jgi:hypothetical protein
MKNEILEVRGHLDSSIWAGQMVNKGQSRVISLLHNSFLEALDLV